MAKKEGIRKLFDNIAPDYDKLNHILSLNIDKGWRKKAVREIADIDKPIKVLDVACGTADFTRRSRRPEYRPNYIMPTVKLCHTKITPLTASRSVSEYATSNTLTSV